ncbi:hypothetical protein CQA53_04875 [Helicobacter didelphidarum]|uniref:Uncharacterized protein n=1 Tax=Helicobacter didelphidarum TaxID=2040648 RepID=A0A3D8IKT6_9HELI|nr:hypothetical protein [Helicobacter didelphidarum]RDU65957.1 hypothetical protein CQA53_04875 [Helicobacter didelphidarum]
MTKQVKIFIADTHTKLQHEINSFCVDFFPEEIHSINVYRDNVAQNIEWIGCVIYQRDEYQE